MMMEIRVTVIDVIQYVSQSEILCEHEYDVIMMGYVMLENHMHDVHGTVIQVQQNDDPPVVMEYVNILKQRLPVEIVLYLHSTVVI